MVVSLPAADSPPPSRLPLVGAHLSALRDEPKMRAYLAAALVDDLGVAVSLWGLQLLQTNLFTDQRERARLLMPALLCLLVGTVVAGPLADWAARSSALRLARHRWRTILWGRALETASLAAVVWASASGTPTLRQVLPYFLVSSFMKTALRPTRGAFEVDLLQRERPQVDADGVGLTDERGAPRVFKVHLLSFGVIVSALKTAAMFGGLLLGGRILGAAAGAYRPLFVVDIATNVVFMVVVFVLCHPGRGAVRERIADLLRLAPDEPSTATAAVPAARGVLVRGLREFGVSVGEAFRFLRGRDQRPLFWLLFGAWMVEVVTELYDGKMIVKHGLGGDDASVRHAEIVWSLVAIVTLACIPALARKLGSLGKVFLLTMLVDGLVIAAAGRTAAAGTMAAFLPFVALLAADKGLTLTSNTLADLAMNSASSAALRGRIAAAFAFVVLISDIVAEGVSTAVSEAVGIPGMLVRAGLTQAALVGLVALVGGRALWSFGLRAR